MDTHYWKGRKPDKKEEISKSYKKKKPSRLTITYYLDKNIYPALQPKSLKNQKKLLQLIIKLCSS